jgi:hypothetical protein
MEMVIPCQGCRFIRRGFSQEGQPVQRRRPTDSCLPPSQRGQWIDQRAKAQQQRKYAPRDGQVWSPPCSLPQGPGGKGRLYMFRSLRLNP